MEFPKRVREIVGYALYAAQCGEKSPNAKPLKGIGSGVLEVVADYDGIPIELFIQCVYLALSSYCIAFKRKVSTASKHRNKI